MNPAMPWHGSVAQHARCLATEVAQHEGFLGKLVAGEGARATFDY